MKTPLISIDSDDFCGTEADENNEIHFLLLNISKEDADRMLDIRGYDFGEQCLMNEGASACPFEVTQVIPYWTCVTLSPTAHLLTIQWDGLPGGILKRIPEPVNFLLNPLSVMGADIYYLSNQQLK